MTWMTGLNCAVMCSLINMHTYIYIHTYIHTGAIIVHVGSSHGFVSDADDAPAVGRNLLILYPQTAGAAADLSLGALWTGGCPRVLGGA